MVSLQHHNIQYNRFYGLTGYIGLKVNRLYGLTGLTGYIQFTGFMSNNTNSFTNQIQTFSCTPAIVVTMIMTTCVLNRKYASQHWIFLTHFPLLETFLAISTPMLMHFLTV